MSEFSAELYATALMLPPEFWLVSANDEQPSKNDLSAGGKSSKGNAFATGGGELPATYRGGGFKLHCNTTTKSCLQWGLSSCVEHNGRIH